MLLSVGRVQFILHCLLPPLPRFCLSKPNKTKWSSRKRQHMFLVNCFWLFFSHSHGSTLWSNLFSFWGKHGQKSVRKQKGDCGIFTACCSICCILESWKVFCGGEEGLDVVSVDPAITSPWSIIYWYHWKFRYDR